MAGIRTLWAAVEGGSDTREDIVEGLLRFAARLRESIATETDPGSRRSARSAAHTAYLCAHQAAGWPETWPNGGAWLDRAPVPGFDDQAAA